VIFRQPKGNQFPTVLTNASVTQTTTEYIFTFNDSGTIKWGV
jgi:hypothetical protein